MFLVLNKLESLISGWKMSPRRKEQIKAYEYYLGHHDILSRERQMIGENGVLVPVPNLVNHRIVDNQYKKAVDQKANYALGRPLTIGTDDESYAEEMGKLFDSKLNKCVHSLGKHAIQGGIAWLHPYYSSPNELSFRVFPAYEILPIWNDNGDLESAVRVYTAERWSGNKLLVEERADVYKSDGIKQYVLNKGLLEYCCTIPHLYVAEQPYNWTRIPLIPFRYNEDEIPLLRNIKELQDSINLVLSNFVNNMDEDPRTTILILKNYDGTDLPEFRRNLATYGVVKVHSIDGVQGNVETLRIDVNSENYATVLLLLKKSLVENARGFDSKDERMDGDPNEMNIQSMYTDIDLDVNGMESEFQCGFQDLRWFLDTHLQTVKGVDYSDNKLEFVFNRDIFVNESTKVNIAKTSLGIISKKTIVEHHPWVTDADKEIKRIEDEEEDEGLGGMGVPTMHQDPKSTSNPASNKSPKSEKKP